MQFLFNRGQWWRNSLLAAVTDDLQITIGFRDIVLKGEDVLT